MAAASIISRTIHNLDLLASLGISACPIHFHEFGAR
jgi:hypothetical protein